jgi:hypothetical protein
MTSGAPCLEVVADHELVDEAELQAAAPKARTAAAASAFTVLWFIV